MPCGDPLFRKLLDDGSLEVASAVARKAALEADPMKDAEPSGKRAAGRKTAGKTAAEGEKHLTNSTKQDIMEYTNND